MTVIAYDHKKKEISVDSLLTSGDIISGRATKYAHLPDGGIVFGAGLWSACKRIFSALAASETPREEDFAECSIILVKGGKVYEMDSSPTREPVTKSWAWGSGRDVALGALHVGASSADACGAAVALTSSCGGPVHTFSTKGQK